MKKIMLCCNAGMSTSLLVQKMQKYVVEEGYEIEIEAYSMGEGLDRVSEADCILLGPQIGYGKKEYEAATDKPVDVIPMVDYGRMNASKIVETALKMMSK